VLAIAQAGQQFHYLSWTPTTTEPVLNGHGVKSYEKSDLSSPDFFKSLFGELIEQFKLKTPRIYLTLDIDSVHLSETQIPQNIEFKSFHNWLMSTNYDSNFSRRFESFYYPFESKISKSLNVHMPVSIKSAILESIKFHNAELRFLSLGIFSAESCLRSIYNSEKIGDYIVWRLGSHNQNDILWIRKNKLVSFIRFKNINGIFKLHNYYGCSKSTDKILNQLEKCISGDFSRFNISKKVYIYSSSNKINILENIINSNPNHFQIIELSQKFNLKIDRKFFIFAETGISFRGFDV
tara:strand:+ start:1108 stop:1989 length:882 start_codon:yes stop_codon:yes gene_type:complete